MKVRIVIQLHKLDELDDLFKYLSRLEKQYNLKDCTVEIEKLW